MVLDFEEWFGPDGKGYVKVSTEKRGRFTDIRIETTLLEEHRTGVITTDMERCFIHPEVQEMFYFAVRQEISRQKRDVLQKVDHGTHGSGSALEAAANPENDPRAFQEARVSALP